MIRFHPHAKERMRERGATEDEVMETVFLIMVKELIL